MTAHIDIAVDSAAWTAFRAANPSVRPDLRGANLEEAHLSGDFSDVQFDGARLVKAQFPARLHRASFDGADLKDAWLQGDSEARAEFDRRWTSFRGAHLTQAKLFHADFGDADFSNAFLRGGRLEGADLTNANFTGANLENARLDGADLRRAIFAGARFGGTSFEGALLGWTVFDGVDLGEATGLDSVEHRAPSALTVSALYRSAGRVPETFLLGSQRDAPEDFLLKLRDTLRRTRFEYRSCFISYAREDAPFVDELAARLQRAHVPVWRDSESLQPGQTFESRIIDAIARYDCFVVVLSASALESDWVRKEIALAIERKPYRILPIRLDDAVLHSVETGPLELRRERHVADFSRWGKPVEFKTQFERLLRALRRE